MVSSIKISELSPVGSDLFQDDENFLTDLTDWEMEIIAGGAVQSAISQNTVSAQTVNNRAFNAMGANVAAKAIVPKIPALNLQLLFWRNFTF